MPEPLISVIIPSYNSAQFVAQSVDSALAQTYQPLEIVVVDDGSTDNTIEVLAPYVDRIRLICQPNGGLAAARNRGMQESRGELFAFLDADDQWLPEKLTRQMAILRGHPEMALVHADVFYWDQDTDETSRRDVGRAQFVGACYERLFFENRVLPSTVLVRRECIDRVGPFAMGIPGVEDMELWLRLARYYSFGFIGDPLVIYRLHSANMTRNHLQIRAGELGALEKALANDPALLARIGRSTAYRRLSELSLAVGYHHFEQANYLQARRFFAKALGYQPMQPYPALMWFAACLPASIVHHLRRFKQRIWEGV